MSKETTVKCESCLKAVSKSFISNDNICKSCQSLLFVDFDQTIVNFVKESPFYGNISKYIHKYRNDDISTIGVRTSAHDYHISLAYNHNFFYSLKLYERYEVLKHEFLHIILGHIVPPGIVGSRITNSTNMYLWNIACDLAINSLLDEARLPPFVYLPGKPILITEKHQKHIDSLKPELKERYLKEIGIISTFVEQLPKFQTSEWYYKEILKNNDVSSALMGNIDFIVTYSSMDYHDDWYDSLSEQQKESFKKKIDSILREAVLESDRKKNWGNVPKNLQQYLRAYVSRQLNWVDILRMFCGRCRSNKKSTSLRRVNKKYPHIHPGVIRNRTARIAIALDESGSVSNETLEMFFSELTNLSNETEFTVIPFDAQVHEDKIFVWRKTQKITNQRVACGGTDFNVPTNWINQYSSKYDGFIILTDGYCEKPIASKVKRAYIICPDGQLQFQTNEVVINMNKK